MDKKTKGLIISMAAGVLFGCPGLVLLAFGVLAILPTSTKPSSANTIHVGVVSLILGIILVIITIGISLLALINKPETPANNQSVPPAS